MKRSLGDRLNILVFLAAAGIPTVLLLILSYFQGGSVASHLGIALAAFLIVVLMMALFYSHASMLRLVEHLVREMLRPAAGETGARGPESTAVQERDRLAGELQRLTEAVEQRDTLAVELRQLTESLRQRDELEGEVQRLTELLEQKDSQLREIRGKIHEGLLQTRQYAESLQEAGQRLQALVTEAPVGIVMVDLEGKILFSNPSSERIFGLAEREMAGRHFSDVLGQQPQSVIEGLRAAVAGHPVQDLEIRVNRQDDSAVFASLSSSSVKSAEGKLSGCMIVLSDITQRKHAENELLRLRKAVESSGEAIFLTDPDGIITWINPAFTDIYGYTAAEVVGHCTPRVLKGGTLAPEAYRKFWERILRKEVVTGEMVNKTRDGKLVSVESSVNPVLDESGAIIGFLAIQKDVSDRKVTEAALHESEELYRTLVETSPDAIFLAALDGTVRLCNQRAVAMAGCGSAAELIGLNAFNFVAEEEREGAREKAHSLLVSHEVNNKEHTLVRKDGSRFPAELSVSLYQDSHGQPKGMVGIMRDLTSRRRLEAQLLQAQKMEAIGKLAGGVAHDFNNLLTAIIGYSDLLLSDSAVTHSMRQDVQAIKKVGEKASGLVRQLLAFSRRQVMQPRVMNLNATIADMSKMLQRLVGENIELVTVLDPGLSYIKADPVQIEQVLLNLAVNSREAMPSGGKLTIETINLEIKDTISAAGSTFPPGDYVLLTVRDTGSGMDQETVTHAFEPFFSTKDSGRGSGLGLSTVYGIVNQSGGSISVESEAGKGTTFKICLPRVEPRPEQHEPAQPPKKSIQGNETILVAEDEEGVRRVVRSFLEGKGYRVLEARDGLEAMEIYEKHQGLVHLLVTDLVMPRMGGFELGQRLLKADPGLRVLYMSGYSDQAVASQGNLEPGTMFLQKPFSTDTLAQCVRQLLDNSKTNES